MTMAIALHKLPYKEQPIGPAIFKYKKSYVSTQNMKKSNVTISIYRYYSKDMNDYQSRTIMLKILLKLEQRNRKKCTV